MLHNLDGCFWADEWRKLFAGRLCNPLDRAELAQEFQFSFLAHSRYLRELGCEISHLPSLSMILHRGLVGLLADLKDKPECKRVSIEWYGLVLTSMYQQMRDLIVSFRRLHKSD